MLSIGNNSHTTCYRLLHGLAILDPKIKSKRKHVEYESLSGLLKLNGYEMMITFLSFCSQMNILHPSDISLVVSCIVTGQCAESTRSCFHAGGVPNFMHKGVCRLAAAYPLDTDAFQSARIVTSLKTKLDRDMMYCTETQCCGLLYLR